MTGVTPQEHGIISNTPFDPLNVNKEGWYWYAEDIKATDVVGSCRAGRPAHGQRELAGHGRRSKHLLSVPEYWRASTGDDLKLMRHLDRPEDLMEQLEAKLGPFVDGYVGTVESDWIRTRFAMTLLRERKPQFMAVHIIALDEIEHARGPFIAPAFEALEQLDKMIGEMMDAAVAVDPSAVVAVVSDHGFIATHTAVNLRTRFVEAGLIKLKQSPSGATVIDDWQGQLWSGAASAAVVLRDPANKEVKGRVEALLKSLAAESRNGIARVLDKAALKAAGAFPTADFAGRVRPRLLLRQRDPGEMLRPAVSKGTHGYLPRGRRCTRHSSSAARTSKRAATSVSSTCGRSRRPSPGFSACACLTRPSRRCSSAGFLRDQPVQQGDEVALRIHGLHIHAVVPVDDERWRAVDAVVLHELIGAATVRLDGERFRGGEELLRLDAGSLGEDLGGILQRRLRRFQPPSICLHDRQLVARPDGAVHGVMHFGRTPSAAAV